MIRYRRLGHLVLNVSDLDRSEAFYRDTVGLQALPSPDPGTRLLRGGGGTAELALVRGTPGLARIGFELESARQLEPLATALGAAGVPSAPIPDADRLRLGLGPGLRTAEPTTGAVLDIYAPQPHVHGQQVPPGGRFGLLQLGHLVIDAADPLPVLRFFTEVLQFVESDHIEGAITFLRCFPNPLHHSIGIANGRGRSALNHLCFMVAGADDIGRSLWRLQREHAAIVNGPGRHLPSGSLFLYFLDPDGLTVEYSAGMEEFAEQGARSARVLPCEPRSFDLWEGPVDPRKAAVGEIERSLQ